MNLTKVLMSIRNQTKIYILCKGVCVLSQEFVVATAGLYLPAAKILLSQPPEDKKVALLVPITAPNFEIKLTNCEDEPMLLKDRICYPPL